MSASIFCRSAVASVWASVAAEFASVIRSTTASSGLVNLVSAMGVLFLQPLDEVRAGILRKIPHFVRDDSLNLRPCVSFRGGHSPVLRIASPTEESSGCGSLPARPNSWFTWRPQVSIRLLPKQLISKLATLSDSFVQGRLSKSARSLFRPAAFLFSLRFSRLIRLTSTSSKMSITRAR